jgi:N,N'-diacetyllegionaminate synthase
MGKHAIIIAEAGVNHNGSIELAKKLIDVAAHAGVDYVKFQTFKADQLVTKRAQQAAYQTKNIGVENSQYEMLKQLELNSEQHFQLIDYCNQSGIKFLSTAFDMESVEFLSSLDLGLWKIPSGEITNYPYLKRIAQEKQPIILSSGMSTIEDIRLALDVLVKHGTSKEKMTVLHCNTQYPTPMQDVNLLAMRTIGREANIDIGYSDHTLGIEVPIAAVALGATIIEKHFTLDRNMEGPDHKASLEPDELKTMVKAIRNVETSLGSPEKFITISESENVNIARKSLVAAMPIKKGELFTEINLTTKRPGNGISPMRWEEILGKKAIRHFFIDELIEL